jgi:hypothetical protein
VAALIVLLPIIVLSAVWFGLEDVVGGEDGGTPDGSGWAAVPYVGFVLLGVVTVVAVRRRGR